MCGLNVEEMAPIKSVCDFACEWLGKTGARCDICYNELDERMEFKAVNDAEGVQIYIAFEPGYPDLEFTDEDIWLTEED